MESKKKQLYENLRDLKNAVQVRMDNKTTTAAELDAIAEKLLKCCIDVMTITVRPVEGEGPTIGETIEGRIVKP